MAKPNSINPFNTGVKAEKGKAGTRAVSRGDVLRSGVSNEDISSLTSNLDVPVLNYPGTFLDNRSANELSKVHAEHGAEHGVGFPVSGSDLAKMRGKSLDIGGYGTLSVVPDRANHPNRVLGGKR